MNRTKLLQAMLLALSTSLLVAATASAAGKTQPQGSTTATQSADAKSQSGYTQPMNDDMSKPSKPAKARASKSGAMTIASLTKFEDLDKNKDGEIEKDEVPANLDLVNSFASYDKDSNGKLSKDEFAAYQHGGRNMASSKPAKKPMKQK